METLKRETVLNGEKFFIKVILAYTMSRKKTSKQES